MNGDLSFFQVILLTVLVGIVGSALVWMNLTPGHFQKDPCGCGVSYIVIKETPLRCTALQGLKNCSEKSTINNLIETVLSASSLVDFYK